MPIYRTPAYASSGYRTEANTNHYNVRCGGCYNFLMEQGVTNVHHFPTERIQFERLVHEATWIGKALTYGLPILGITVIIVLWIHSYLSQDRIPAEQMTNLRGLPDALLTLALNLAGPICCAVVFNVIWHQRWGRLVNQLEQHFMQLDQQRSLREAYNLQTQDPNLIQVKSAFDLVDRLLEYQQLTRQSEFKAYPPGFRNIRPNEMNWLKGIAIMLPFLIVGNFFLLWNDHGDEFGINTWLTQIHFWHLFAITLGFIFLGNLTFQLFTKAEAFARALLAGPVKLD